MGRGVAMNGDNANDAVSTVNTRFSVLVKRTLLWHVFIITNAFDGKHPMVSEAVLKHSGPIGSVVHASRHKQAGSVHVHVCVCVCRYVKNTTDGDVRAASCTVWLLYCTDVVLYGCKTC